MMMSPETEERIVEILESGSKAKKASWLQFLPVVSLTAVCLIAFIVVREKQSAHIELGGHAAEVEATKDFEKRLTKIESSLPRILEHTDKEQNIHQTEDQKIALMKNAIHPLSEQIIRLEVNQDNLTRAVEELTKTIKAQ